MADLKISQLPALGDNLATADKIAVVDGSASETKSLTIANLFSANSFNLLGSNAIPIAKVSVTAGSIAGTAVADLGISTAKVANDAITAAKLDNNSSAQIVTSLPGSGGFTGQIAANSNDGYAASIWDGSAWQSLKAAASINTINGDTSSIVNIAVATSGSTRTISASIDDSSAAAQFLAGPSGAAGAVSLRAITGADLPTATSSALGAIKVNGEGLRMDTGVIEIDNDVTASSAYNLVAVTAKGLVSAYRTITAADLPDGSSSAKGALQVGTGLAVSNGVVSVDNTATAGTYTKVTITASGLVSSGTTLSSTDLPAHSAALLTSGNLDIARVQTNAITGNKLADASTTQFGGPGSTSQIVTFPSARFKGDRFWDEYHGDEYIWTGSSWAAVTITGGELIYGGTYNAASGQNKVASVTTAGAAAGLQTGTGLPSPSATNIRVYVVISDSGTGTGNAPNVALAPPDMLVSNGTNSWDLIDVSNAIAGQTSSNISFTPYGNIASTNAQAAIQELDDEKVGKAGINTITGTLEIGNTGVFRFEGSTVNDYEIQLSSADPLTADRNIVLPDQSGNVLVQGNASLVNADVATNCALAYSKLAALANGSILIGSASNVATVQALSGDATLSNAGVLTIASSAITNSKISSSAAIALSKLATGALPTAITIANSNVASDAAIAGTKISPDFGTQAITTTGNLTLNNQADLRLGDSDGSNYTAIQAGATIGTNYTIELPTTVGATGKVLKSTVSGQVATLTWEDDASNTAASALTGNTLASGVTASSLQSLGTLSGLVVDGDMTLTGQSANVVWDKSDNALEFADNAKATFGSNLSIDTNGTNNNIKSLSGHLNIYIADNKSFTVGNSDFTENIFLATQGAGCTLYHAANAKVSTSSTGATVTGTLVADGLTVDTNTLHVDATNNRVGIGTTSPTDLLTISYAANSDDGISIVNTNNTQSSAIAQLELSGGDNAHCRVQFECNGKYSSIRHDGNGNLSLYTDGSSTALTLDSSQNATFTGNIRVNDSKQVQLGTGSDTYMWHDGSNGYFRNTTGSFYFQSKSTENAIRIVPDGEVALFYNDGERFRTLDTGARFLSAEGGVCDIEMMADEGDDNADKWRFQIDTSGNFKIDNYSTGSWVNGLTVNGSNNATFAGTVSDSKGELRTIPQLSKSSAHTIVASDAGKHSINSSGGWVINTSTGFTAGQAITLINNSSGDQTITSTGVTLYNSADGSTPTKIATRGMATVICTASNTYYISGAGLS